MIYLFTPFLFLFSQVALGDHAEERVDEILATIYHKDGVELVLKSDIRLGIDGQPRDLKSVIRERLWMLQGKLLQVVPDVEKFIDQLAQQNGVSRAAVDAMFREVGFTPEEGRLELERKQLIDAAIDYRIRGSKELIVEHEAIVEYDNAHPIMTDPVYTLAQAYVPHAEMGREELDEAMQDSDFMKTLTFDTPFMVSHSEVPEDRQEVLINASVGAIVEIDDIQGYYEITKLVAIKPAERVSISIDRAREIDMILKRDRYMQLMREYEAKLFSESYILFTYSDDQVAVLGTQSQQRSAQ